MTASGTPPIVAGELNLFSLFAPDEISNRLRISSGTRQAGRPDDDVASPYRSGAILPREPWRTIELTQIAELFELGGRWNRSRSILVMPLPRRQRLDLEKLKLATSPGDLVNTEKFIARAGRDCLRILAKFFLCSADTCCYGVGINQPNMITTSIDRNIDRIVGLHVDHWDGLPLTSRPTAGNRLAINVGKSAYYFLVVPATLGHMARSLGCGYRDDVDLNELPGRFLAAYPNLPVCRFEIAPGDVYVAPTDNILHDGSTHGIKTESRQIVFRGRISPLPEPFEVKSGAIANELG